jgi:hypothetical protein
MKRNELKEMIKAAYLSEADFTSGQDDDAAPAIASMYDPLAEAEEEESLDDILARITGTKVDPYLAEAEEEETDITVDAEEETTDGGEEKPANDSIVVDKKIVSLSSLPNDTRKILDSLETLRAQAEEFGDQKFITQVGNTITFFTRDFVVAGDEPTKAKVDESLKIKNKTTMNESLEILKMKKLAGLLKEGEYAKALLKEIEEEKSDITELTSTEQRTLDALIGDVNEAIFDLGKVKDFAKKGLLTIGVLGALLGGPDLSAQQKQDVVNIAKTEMGISVDHLVKKDNQDATTKVSTSDPMKQIRSEFPTARTGRFQGGSSLNWGAHGGNQNASAGLSIVYNAGSPFIQITISQVPGKSTTAYTRVVKQANELARDGGKPQTDGNKIVVDIDVKKEKVGDVIKFLQNNVNNL